MTTKNEISPEHVKKILQVIGIVGILFGVLTLYLAHVVGSSLFTSGIEGFLYKFLSFGTNTIWKAEMRSPAYIWFGVGIVFYLASIFYDVEKAKEEKKIFEDQLLILEEQRLNGQRKKIDDTNNKNSETVNDPEKNDFFNILRKDTTNTFKIAVKDLNLPQKMEKSGQFVKRTAHFAIVSGRAVVASFNSARTERKASSKATESTDQKKNSESSERIEPTFKK